MEKKIINSNFIFNAVVSIILIAVIIFLYVNENSSKVVYVDSVYVFENFNMKKEADVLFNKKLKNQERVLDSLYKILKKSLEDNKDSIEFKKSIYVYENAEMELKEIKNNYKKTLAISILNRIKQYAKEFAQEKNYKLIISSDNILFGDNNMDVSKSFLRYCNFKYEGFK